MTIVEAIKEVMRREGRPLTPREVWRAIVSAGLYEFKSENASSIVATQIRRHCAKRRTALPTGRVLFDDCGGNRYCLSDGAD